MGDGTYLSFTDVTESDATVASQGDVPFVPATTQRSSDEQASVTIELGSEATFDHVRPKLSVRTIRHPVESLANPRHLRPAQFKEVRAAHVSVEVFVRVVHGVSPLDVAATRIPLDEFTKLAMHRIAEAHDSDVAVSWVGTPTDCGEDHETPASTVKRILEPPVDESSIAQDCAP